MDYVTSDDGTRIAFERSGDGPPLILVHGTAADHRTWDRVRPALAERFTVYAVDRRGRGDSGDGEAYAVEREFEDLAALAASIDGPVNLLGHSYGAVCSIGAALRLSELRRLILYEPPLWTPDRERLSTALLDRMDDLADRGENERVLEVFFEEVVGSTRRLEGLRSSSDYDRHVAAAERLPRELRGRERFRPTPETYSVGDVPTMLLTGTDSSASLQQSTEAATDLFPDSRLVRLPGRGHGAMHTAPDRFVSEVSAFLRGEGQGASVDHH